MKKKPVFLLSNDDGITSQGLLELAHVIKEFGELFIVAPASEQSACSHAITITKPLRVKNIKENMYSVSGTPADCVMIACQNLLDVKPDWVISGINKGSNLGTDVIYSGTVGAAMEGCIQGCRAMAISLDTFSAPFYFSTACKIFTLLFNQTNPDELINPGELLNINVPNIKFDQIKSIRSATLGKRTYTNTVQKRHDPRGIAYYWIGGGDRVSLSIEGSDCNLSKENHVTYTVLSPSLYNKASTEKAAFLMDAKLKKL